MKIFKSVTGVFVEDDGKWFSFGNVDWDAFINRTNLHYSVKESMGSSSPISERPKEKILAPIQNQEVWAAGVTYLKSKIARMEEAEAAGGGDFYDRVYDAPRPEIFFKATAARTVGHEEDVYIRRDSTWDVPEPELTLFLTSAGTIEGYTIGNDMSSRSIEGENPLYLPQAKTYERCAALGPCILVKEKPISPETQIGLVISRGEKIIYRDSVKVSQMKRTHEELAEYLFRECHFSNGCFLMTGTCLVPDHPFTLQEKDRIEISIDGIGTLINTVARQPA